MEISSSSRHSITCITIHFNLEAKFRPISNQGRLRKKEREVNRGDDERTHRATQFIVINSIFHFTREIHSPAFKSAPIFHFPVFADVSRITLILSVLVFTRFRKAKTIELVLRSHANLSKCRNLLLPFIVTHSAGILKRPTNLSSV